MSNWIPECEYAKKWYDANPYLPPEAGPCFYCQDKTCPSHIPECFEKEEEKETT